MADTAKVTAETKEVELNLSKRVTVRNMTSIPTWVACIEKEKAEKVPAKGTRSFPISEIIAQIDAMNPDFVGFNGDGSHANLYIEDKQVRIHVEFESEDGKKKQEVIDEQAILNMFDATTLQSFTSQLETKVLTMGEKQTLRDVIAKGKVNAHDKIDISEKFLRNEPIEIPKGKPGRPKNS